MSEQIRSAYTLTKTLTNVLGTTPVLLMHDFAGALIILPASWSGGNISVYVSKDEDGTYVQLLDVDGSAVVITGVASRAIELPSAIFAAQWVKLVCSATGSYQTVDLLMKS